VWLGIQVPQPASEIPANRLVELGFLAAARDPPRPAWTALVDHATSGRPPATALIEGARAAGFAPPSYTITRDTTKSLRNEAALTGD
jgi:hypothetical protein